jgi:hypothetical protein
MAEGLGAPWSWFAVLRVLPLAWRDRLYELVARNRLNWFGRREVCYLRRARARRPVPGVSDDRLTILILGGYGTFGGRIAQLLADEPQLDLLIAGRSLAKAERFCAELGGQARARPVLADRDGDLAAQLREAAPHVVVDATGPFQGYGEHPYRVVEACLAQGCDYLDLADGSEFVAGVAALDVRAREAGRFALSGVSSFPVLTAAVVRRLARDLDDVGAVTGGIAPSPYAGVGLNVIRAIAGYAGKPLPLVRDGRPAQGRALTETRRYTIAPPGGRPLDHVLFSLVDVPDLRVLPELWPGLRSVWMGAGPVPEPLHRMLIALAWLVRLRVLPTLEPLAPLFHWGANTLRWGPHRGGMFVEVEGAREGRPVRRAWHMTAETRGRALHPLHGRGGHRARPPGGAAAGARRPLRRARPGARRLRAAVRPPAYPHRRVGRAAARHAALPPPAGRRLGPPP